MNLIKLVLKTIPFIKTLMTQMDINDPLEAIRGIVSEKWTIARAGCHWRDYKNTILLTVTSDGTSGEEWIERLENAGFRVSVWAKDLLRSSNFKPTTGETTKIVVLKGELFYKGESSYDMNSWLNRDKQNGVEKQIMAMANKKKLIKPSMEVACLIRENFSDIEIEKMGFSVILIMHDPTIDSLDMPRLLGVYRRDGGRCLDISNPDIWCPKDLGFAFVDPN